MTGRISPRTCYTKLNFDFSYVRFLSLRRDTYYVSDAHSTTSWLDHIICSHDVKCKMTVIEILDKLPSSDHLPLRAAMDQ